MLYWIGYYVRARDKKLMWGTLFSVVWKLSVLILYEYDKWNISIRIIHYFCATLGTRVIYGTKDYQAHLKVNLLFKELNIFYFNYV